MIIRHRLRFLPQSCAGRPWLALLPRQAGGRASRRKNVFRVGMSAWQAEATPFLCLNRHHYRKENIWSDHRYRQSLAVGGAGRLDACTTGVECTPGGMGRRRLGKGRSARLAAEAARPYTLSPAPARVGSCPGIKQCRDKEDRTKHREPGHETSHVPYLDSVVLITRLCKLFTRPETRLMVSLIAYGQRRPGRGLVCQAQSPGHPPSSCRPPSPLLL